MTSIADTPSRCEERERLCAELEAMRIAVKKATDILAYPTDSPDTLRRRQNAMVRWNEFYSAALARLEVHNREHNCGLSTASSAP